MYVKTVNQKKDMFDICQCISTSIFFGCKNILSKLFEFLFIADFLSSSW